MAASLKIIFFVLLLSLGCTKTNAQKDFYEIIDPGAYSDIQVSDMLVNQQNEVYLTGHINRRRGFSLKGSYLLKLNDKGDSLWCRSFRKDSIHYSKVILQSSPETFTFLGEYRYDNGHNRLVCFQTDTSGNFLWKKVYGIYDSKSYDMAQTENGDLLFLWQDQYDAEFRGMICTYLTKTNENGEVLWEEKYRSVMPGHLLLLKNDTCIITSRRLVGNSMNVSSTFATKLDKDKNVIWEQKYLSAVTYDVFIKQSSENEYYIGFSAATNAPEASAEKGHYILKVNQKGEIIWGRKFVDQSVLAEKFVFEPTPDGGLIFMSSNDPLKQDKFLYTVKLDQNGATEWIRSYGIEKHSINLPGVIQVCSDGTYAIAAQIHITSTKENHMDPEHIRKKREMVLFIRTNSSGEVRGFMKEGTDFLQISDIPK